MRIVFMGTPEFAVPVLTRLASAHDVVGVYSRPDAVSGRGNRLRPTPVKEEAERLGLAVFQPRSLRTAEVVADLAALNADVCVVAAYGAILPPQVLDLFPLGCINVHASLLPRWRGAAPIQRAILAGDAEAGVSIMRMEEGLDTGPFCATARTAIGSKSLTMLTAELSRLGAGLILECLEDLADGRCSWNAQDETLVTYADKVTKHDVALTPALPRLTALRRVQASSPAAPSRLVVGGTGATLTAAEASDAEVVEPGHILRTRKHILLGFVDGALSVLSIKPDGRREIDGPAWGRGLRDDITEWSPVS